MNRCLGPCTGRIGEKEYGKIIASVEKFFEKGLDAIIEELKTKMELASNRQDFEEATTLRDKIKWIEMASVKKRAFSTKKIKKAGSLEEISRLTGMSKLPKRIEAFDISNLGPDQTVGAMVTFINGAPSKKNYRKFNISEGPGPSDTAAIFETVFRRYSRSLSRQLPDPDLILIDGGKGQLSSAADALARSKKDIPALGLAKKNEEIYMKNLKDPLRLPGNSPALLLLRQIRDEVHRFAVSFHRQKRSKQILKNL
jgi:excinuclease ABC subunit C